MIRDNTYLTITPTTANNGITPILNTTLLATDPASSTAIGMQRNLFINQWLVVPYILCTGQNVTLRFRTLINGAWADAVDVPAGMTASHTIVAQANPREGFALRMYAETNVFIVNGATGPTVLDIGRPYITCIDPGNLPS